MELVKAILLYVLHQLDNDNNDGLYTVLETALKLVNGMEYDFNAREALTIIFKEEEDA